MVEFAVWKLQFPNVIPIIAAQKFRLLHIQ